jgi:hypothetical protein
MKPSHAQGGLQENVYFSECIQIWAIALFGPIRAEPVSRVAAKAGG